MYFFKDLNRISKQSKTLAPISYGIYYTNKDTI